MTFNYQSSRSSRRWRFKLGFSLIALALVAGSFYAWSQISAPEPAESYQLEVEETQRSVKPPVEDSESADQFSTPTVVIKDITIPVEVRRTPAELAQGLSGKEVLPESNGMLFVFPAGSRPGFWMPNMNFPIDMVWINEGVIVGITANVSHDFNPANPKFYYPPVPIDHVLEVNAGFMARHDLVVGDVVNFLNL